MRSFILDGYGVADALLLFRSDPCCHSVPMRLRIEEWKSIYDTDENAITKALSKLAWDLAAFTCIVEMVRQAPDEGEGKRLNGMVLEMLVTGFWNNMMQGVRRLAEPGPIRGPRAVCSLGGLLQDARAARHGITRRVFVEDIAGLDYDFEAIEERHWAYVLAQREPGYMNIPRALDSEPSRQRHVLFDQLSGVLPENRTPDDLIKPEVFEGLHQRLARLDGVVHHVHVQIAHAGTQFSRTGRQLQQWNLTDARDSLKELAQIAQLAGDWFCYSGVGSILPHPQFDQFAHIDQALYTGDPAPLQAIWDNLEREMGQWHDVDLQAL